MRRCATSYHFCHSLAWLLFGFTVTANPAMAWEYDTTPPFQQIQQTQPADSQDQPDYMRYQPYNDGYIELNLWQLENNRFVRSKPVISPDKRWIAYSEVTFIGRHRQTFSRLFIAPVPDLPNPPKQGQYPEEAYLEQQKERKEPQPLPALQYYEARYNPNQSLNLRESIYEVGDRKTIPHGFQTLTIIDWSAHQKRLLFKQSSGIRHLGLKTSDILVYDTNGNTVTIYPELQRIIRYYWLQQNVLPDLNQVAWDMIPLGWEPHSDNNILIKAWAFDTAQKTFLGLWRYDIDTEQAQLISLEDFPPAVAANGLTAEPDRYAWEQANAERQK